MYYFYIIYGAIHKKARISYLACFICIRLHELIFFKNNKYISRKYIDLKYINGTDQAGTFMSLKCVVYYANYRSWQQSSKIQVVS